MMSTVNEIALVTGASRGIGKAIALALGQQGITIIGTATTPEGAKSISDYLAASNISGAGIAMDVVNQTSITNGLASIEKDFGTPVILVNNAGITQDNLLLRMKDEEWDSVINTNLSSIYRLSKACLRGMIKARKGRIISIASVVGITGNAGQTNYAAAKAGIIGFTKSLAREVASRNITANVVAPGFIDTDMTKQLPEEQKVKLLAQIPLNRLGDVNEVAATVVFLASQAAGYITGETIHVNGGMSMN